MTPAQWFDIADQIQRLWGRSQAWAGADELAPRVQALPYDVACQIVEDMLLEGPTHAPKPAEIISKTIAATRTGDDTVRRLAEAHCREVGHLEAVQAGQVICCARCGHTPTSDQDPISERIAP